MSNEDADSRTEDATEKKLGEAIERGVVPISLEASLLASLGGMLIVMVFILPASVDRLVSMLVYFVDDPGGWTINNGDDAIALSALLIRNVSLCLVPIVVTIMVCGVVAAVAQNAPRIVLDRIKPDLSRISMREGLKRVLGLHGLTNFVKSVFKLSAVGVIGVMVLNSERVALVNSSVLDIATLPYRILDISIRLIAALIVATLVIASIDLVWARLHWRRGQRMSHQEIKEEMKQIEGDPLIKARLRSIRMDRARKRMLTAVPKATMVIVNPTHYAVALRYVRSEGGAPIVVAKGLDLIALKVREIARESGIPIVEDKPLARSLYDAVKVDSAIPPEFYRAIAELVHLISKKKSAWPLVR